MQQQQQQQQRKIHGQHYHWQSGKTVMIHYTGGLKSYEKSGLHSLTPSLNHWWNSSLYITPHGLTTSPMYYDGRLVQIDFDFISHLLLITTGDNPATKTITLRPCSEAEFYQEIMAALRSLGIPITIWTTPVEVPDRTPFEKDNTHKSYDPEYAQRLYLPILYLCLVDFSFNLKN